MSHLSHPQKMPVPSFDLDPQDSGCADRCAYWSDGICYVKNNPNERYPSRKNILKRNLKLIKSPDFVRVLTKEIRQTRVNDFRFFSAGDIPDFESLLKVIKVCKNLPRVRFWVSTSRDDFLSRFLQTEKIPSNVTLRLSAPKEGIPIPQGMIDYFAPFGVVFSETTDDPNLANCHASIDGSSCGDCDQCWDPKFQISKYFIHGKKAQKEFKKLKEKL